STPSAQGPEDTQYRRILAGQVPGSDFYIVGGITEVNYNIRSGGFDAAVGEVDSDRPGSGIATHRTYVMNIAMDLRLVQTTTLEVV
ncbi:CsgG/HfaB family protein, partial [Klebsiella pneumoniae]|uniref:CsgG/HfaB family protein n=2 Tax=Pseudomonadota TaxID=1224 RepID=UPI0027BAE18D